jgi:hypothetical protein
MALPKIIGRFKMQSAKQINILRNTSGQPVWQRNLPREMNGGMK